jgi:uncharacterized protein with von Willebrand factor type A (vWA) domain
MTEEKKLPDLTNAQIREALTKMHHGLIIMQERLDDHEKVLEKIIVAMDNLSTTKVPNGFRQPKAN